MNDLLQLFSLLAVTQCTVNYYCRLPEPGSLYDDGLTKDFTGEWQSMAQGPQKQFGGFEDSFGGNGGGPMFNMGRDGGGPGEG